jgi:hypothetical protein
MLPNLSLHGLCVQLAVFQQSIELPRSCNRRYESSMAFGMRKALQVTSRVKPERQIERLTFTQMLCRRNRANQTWRIEQFI